MGKEQKAAETQGGRSVKHSKLPCDLDCWQYKLGKTDDAECCHWVIEGILCHNEDLGLIL